MNFFFPFIDIGYFSQVLNLNSVELNCFAKQAKLFLKKPLFQKLWWSCDFPPRKTPVARKHRAISRQEKMAYSTPLSGCLGTPPPPFSESVRAGGRAYAGVTTEISRIDWLPNFLIHGAPQQLQFGQKDLESLNVTHRQLTTQQATLEQHFMRVVHPIPSSTFSLLPRSLISPLLSRSPYPLDVNANKYNESWYSA